jgi:hypothetical protein
MFHPLARDGKDEQVHGLDVVHQAHVRIADHLQHIRSRGEGRHQAGPALDLDQVDEVMRTVADPLALKLGPQRGLCALGGLDQGPVNLVDALNAVGDGLGRRNVGLFAEDDQESVLRETRVAVRRVPGGRSGQGDYGEPRGRRQAQGGGLAGRYAADGEADGGQEEADQEDQAQAFQRGRVGQRDLHPRVRPGREAELEGRMRQHRRRERAARGQLGGQQAHGDGVEKAQRGNPIPERQHVSALHCQADEDPEQKPEPRPPCGARDQRRHHPAQQQFLAHPEG